MFRLAIFATLSGLLTFTPSIAAEPMSPSAGNADLSKAVAPTDLPIPDYAQLVGYHYWPTGVDRILLGPYEKAQDTAAKQKLITGPRKIYFYVMPDNTDEVSVFQQFQSEVQSAGGGVAYQCSGQECTGSKLDIAHSCAGLTAWFFKKGSDDGLYNLTREQRYSVPSSLPAGVSFIGTNGVEDFTDHADVLANPKKPNATDPYISDECHYFAGLIPGTASSKPRYVSVAVVNKAKMLGKTVLFILDVVEDNGFTVKTVTVGADEMSSSLQSQGHVALYGIYFDFDKSTPKPDSTPQIKAIADLLHKTAGQKILIVGHTDNQGGFAYNMALSQRRAQAIVQILQSRYGIDSGRMVAVGDGMTAPIASNSTDNGRAKNRRVELVEQ